MSFTIGIQELFLIVSTAIGITIYIVNRVGNVETRVAKIEAVWMLVQDKLVSHLTHPISPTTDILLKKLQMNTASLDDLHELHWKLQHWDGPRDLLTAVAIFEAMVEDKINRLTEKAQPRWKRILKLLAGQ